MTEASERRATTGVIVITSYEEFDRLDRRQAAAGAEQAQRRIKELHVEDTVEVLEWISESDVDDLLHRSQVLVLPSRNEGQPMAVLEAMARGLCVVVGGIPEMIGDGCGVLTSPDDIGAIADALRLVIRAHRKRAQYGSTAYVRFRTQFDLDVVWRQFDDLYQEVSR